LAAFLGVPYALGHFIGVPNILEHWLEPIFANADKILGHAAHHENHAIEYGLMVVSTANSVAWYLYRLSPVLFGII
jgi:NADH-quinone oxidoreductase subunit L